jgi:hypothetical protein
MNGNTACIKAAIPVGANDSVLCVVAIISLVK